MSEIKYFKVKLGLSITKCIIIIMPPVSFNPCLKLIHLIKRLFLHTCIQWHCTSKHLKRNKNYIAYICI